MKRWRNADKSRPDGVFVPVLAQDNAVIRLTRLNGNPIALNSDLIKFVENAPDTVITLISGEKMVVKESNEEVMHRVVEFRRLVLSGLRLTGTDLGAPLAGVAKHSEESAAEESRRG
jgi:flagellar protein FlbD